MSLLKCIHLFPCLAGIDEANKGRHSLYGVLGVLRGFRSQWNGRQSS